MIPVNFGRLQNIYLKIIMAIVGWGFWRGGVQAGDTDSAALVISSVNSGRGKNKMANVIGNYDKIKRVSSSIFSLDQALRNDVTGETGFPLKTITEIYGNAGLGKSTFSYYLAGEVCKQLKPDGTIALLDFEGMDVDHLPRAISTGGFGGHVQVIEVLDNKGKPKTHEDMLDELVESMYANDDTICSIVDSIGAVVPVPEREAGIEEGFGAKRAVVISKFVRKLNDAILSTKIPKIAIATNHIHQAIGGVGHNTSGGVQLTFAASVRIYIYNSSKDTIKSGDAVLANVLVGKIEKLRYGGKGREFKFVITPGRGVRPLLTSLIDAIDLGIVERGAVLKLDGKSLGRISDAVQHDIEEDRDYFKPIITELNKRKLA